MPLPVLFLVIIVVAAGVYFWGLIAGDLKPGGPRANPGNQPPQPPNRNQQANAEIERFLQRANQQRQQKQPPDRTAAANRSREDEQRRRQQRRPPAPPAPPRQKSSRKRDEPIMAQVLPGPGDSVPDHVRKAFDNRKFEQRASHLGSVDQAVEQLNEQVQHTFDHEVGHLAKSKRTPGRASDETDSTYGSSPLAEAHPLVALLTNPANLRAAIILGEIMQPPTHRWE